MLIVEGYKMFKGTGTIKPVNDKIPPFTEYGTWLYRPDTECWYINGKSFAKRIVVDFKEDIEGQVDKYLLGVEI